MVYLAVDNVRSPQEECYGVLVVQTRDRKFFYMYIFEIRNQHFCNTDFIIY